MSEQSNTAPHVWRESDLKALIDHYGKAGCSDVHLSGTRGLWYVKNKATIHEPGSKDIGGLVDYLINHHLTGGSERFNAELQADASIDLGGEYRGRLAARKSLTGDSVTIRLISRQIPMVSDLGLPPQVVSLVDRPAGLVLFTGQTGSGKTSSIAAMLNTVVAGKQSSIYTLESPIEFVYPEGKSLVTQREVGPHVASFAVGIENAKRSHPKIILVGEILNPETARAAIIAAASGHLVVSTMHAGSTAETVDGLISMFPPAEQELIRTQLSQVLVGIVVQQLIPKHDGTGMALAQEVAFNNRKMSELILNGTMKYANQILEGDGRREGMVSMNMSLLGLVKSRAISPEQAVSMARDQKDMADLLSNNGYNTGDRP